MSKKKTLNILGNSGAKSIDSFFQSVSSNVSSDISIAKPIDMNKLLVNSINIESSNNVESRENILTNLVQHKILYSHMDIKNKIDNLSENEIIEIFKIIKDNNEKYSTNKNGIFINLSTLKKNTIQEISNFLYFCDNNNKVIDKEDIERAKYKDMIHD